MLGLLLQVDARLPLPAHRACHWADGGPGLDQGSTHVSNVQQELRPPAALLPHPEPRFCPQNHPSLVSVPKASVATQRPLCAQPGPPRLSAKPIHTRPGSVAAADGAGPGQPQGLGVLALGAQVVTGSPASWVLLWEPPASLALGRSCPPHLDPRAQGWGTPRPVPGRATTSHAASEALGAGLHRGRGRWGLKLQGQPRPTGTSAGHSAPPQKGQFIPHTRLGSERGGSRGLWPGEPRLWEDPPGGLGATPGL